ncbi:MAG: DUF6476 family protein [Rhodospirillales bacterium]|nr:DUF6476 family protein [Rhodospirillales bacterium]
MNGADEEEPKIGSGMRLLKIAAVVMGVLIIAGTTTLVVLIARRLGVSSPPPPVSAAKLGEPAGSRIVAMARVPNGLALALHGGGEADRVVVIDPATGRVLLRIALTR